MFHSALNFLNLDMACLILPITADDLFQHKGGVLAVRQGFF